MRVRQQDWEVLRDALLEHARSAKIVSFGETPFGKKYIVEGMLAGTNGEEVKLRSVWFLENGSNMPKLVTAYPAPGGRE